jgi:hypothetical protein
MIATISCILTSHNDGPRRGLAVASLLAQRRRPEEMILATMRAAGRAAASPIAGRAGSR